MLHVVTGQPWRSRTFCRTGTALHENWKTTSKTSILTRRWSLLEQKKAPRFAQRARSTRTDSALLHGGLLFFFNGRGPDALKESCSRSLQMLTGQMHPALRAKPEKQKEKVVGSLGSCAFAQSRSSCEQNFEFIMVSLCALALPMRAPSKNYAKLLFGGKRSTRST